LAGRRGEEVGEALMVEIFEPGGRRGDVHDAHQVRGAVLLERGEAAQVHGAEAVRAHERDAHRPGRGGDAHRAAPSSSALSWPALSPSRLRSMPRKAATSTGRPVASDSLPQIPTLI